MCGVVGYRYAELSLIESNSADPLTAFIYMIPFCIILAVLKVLSFLVMKKISNNSKLNNLFQDDESHKGIINDKK